MKKDTKIILFGLLVITLAIGAIFIFDYFQTRSLLKNGTRANALVTARFFELNTKNYDTTSYSFRMTIVPEVNANSTSFFKEKKVQAYVEKETFRKYTEGSIVEVVYEEGDLDHAKLVEEIE